MRLVIEDKEIKQAISNFLNDSTIPSTKGMYVEPKDVHIYHHENCEGYYAEITLKEN